MVSADLREAISTANSNTPSGQTIGECVIPPDGIDLPAGTYTLAIEGTGEEDNLTGDLNILPDLILSGAGAQNTIIQAGSSPGSGIDRVIRLGGFGVLEVQNLTIRHGQTVSYGAGIYCSNSTLTLIDVSISIISLIIEVVGFIVIMGVISSSLVHPSLVTNLVIQMVVVFAWTDATLTIANSTISNNQAGRNGGGIYGTGVFGGAIIYEQCNGYIEHRGQRPGWNG